MTRVTELIGYLLDALLAAKRFIFDVEVTHESWKVAFVKDH